MSRTRFRAILTTGTVAMIVGLPLLGHWHRRTEPPRCAFDGLPIQPTYRVIVNRGRDSDHHFCSVNCAERWLGQPGVVASEVLVTDESTGQLINVAEAWFVLSSVTTNPVNRNHIHVFRYREDAEQHARAFHGEILSSDDRPLRLQARN